jgi:hypothetical protein
MGYKEKLKEMGRRPVSSPFIAITMSNFKKFPLVGN